MNTTETTPPGSLQPRVGLQPPKRLAALVEMLAELRDMAWIEAKIETAKSKQRIWLDVRDWADGVALKLNVTKFLHGASLPENREHPATDGMNARRRPMQPNE